MKGYWHIVALSVSISILTVYFKQHFLLVGCVGWLFYLYYVRRLRKLPLLVSLAFLLFFIFYIPPIDEATYEDIDSVSTSISGKINRSMERTPSKVDFTLHDNITSQTYLIVYFPSDDDTLTSHQYKRIKYGATCEIKGTVKHPDRSRNPGQFNFQNYLSSKGISYQLIVDSLEDIECEGSSVFNKFFSIRQVILDQVILQLSPEAAAWVSALVLGDQSLLDDDIVDVFQRWSLSHILAISGLHVGIIVALIYMLCVKLNIVTKETGEWLIICFLPLYALIAGGEPSVLRASIMVLFFLIFNKVKSNNSITDTISIVFLLLIIAHPYVVYHIGFQLSFLVTFGLILSKKWLVQSPSPTWQLLKISFIAQMMILPLQFSYFHTFQPLSILLNFFVVPYFSMIVIPVMFILLLITPLSGMLTHAIDYVFTNIHYIFQIGLHYIDDLLYFPLILGDFPIYFAIVYYIIFVRCMQLAQQNKLVNAFKYGCALIGLMICLAIRPYLSPVGTVTMLDIGQGDAFVVELPYRKGVFFIDAGATFSFDDFKPTEKVYEHIIRPYLYSRGIGRVDAILLSHNDLDHNGSVPYIIEDMHVSQIIISEFYETAEEELQLWEENNIQVIQALFDEEIVIKDQPFHVLSPKKNRFDDNENSLVVYTTLGGLKWLFTGDIGTQIEKEIIQLFPELSIDVLKVAHHGSNTSTDEAFIQHVQPTYALISAGVNNSYGHPTEEVLETLDHENVTVLRTDESGAVQFRFIKNEGTFFKYLP
ncbi:MAG TPA: DNA internalization-related competence protein ComEC/Rec2 [Virgibacillus sp.]|nr:DNA internalization-related competence protein ComEC/Rec2 [Virgibacillus sp.]